MQKACTDQRAQADQGAHADQRARADQDAHADQRAQAATRIDLPGRRMIEMKSRLPQGRGGPGGPENHDATKRRNLKAAGNKNLVETW